MNQNLLSIQKQKEERSKSGRRPDERLCGRMVDDLVDPSLCHDCNVSDRPAIGEQTQYERWSKRTAAKAGAGWKQNKKKIKHKKRVEKSLIVFEGWWRPASRRSSALRVWCNLMDRLPSLPTPTPQLLIFMKSGAGPRNGPARKWKTEYNNCTEKEKKEMKQCRDNNREKKEKKNDTRTIKEINERRKKKEDETFETRRKLITDNGEVDSAVARGRPFEIDAASVESGVRFPHIVDHEASGGGIIVLHQDRGEEGSFAQDVLVGPVPRPAGVLVSCVVPVVA